MSDISEFDIDEEVEASPVDESADFETDESEAEGTDSESEAQGRRKQYDYDSIPTEEFEFDATPRPRKPKAEGEKGEVKPKREKDPIPEGWMTPTQLMHELVERRIAHLKPQMLYGMVKNGKSFPHIQREDSFPQYVVPVEDETAQAAGDSLKHGPSNIGAVTWVRNHLQARAEREAKREAELAAAAEAAEADPTPEVESESEVVDFES